MKGKLILLISATITILTPSISHMESHSKFLTHGFFGNLFMLTLWILAILGIIYLWQNITDQGGDEK